MSDAPRMESPKVQAQRHFLVDIDMLYDLRLTLLDRLSPSRALEVVHQDKYHKRISDTDLIEGLRIKREEWFGRYQGEFIDLLQASYPTHLMNNIIPITNKYIDENTPGEKPIKRLTINTVYYPFTDEETRIFKAILEERFEGYFEDIRIIYRPYNKLIYEQVVEDYTDYFCYNYQDWLREYHESEHPRYKPSFRLYAPQLVRGNLDNPELAKRTKALLEDMSIWTILSAVYAPAFEIHWLPVDNVVDSRIQFELPQKEKDAT